MTLFQCTWLACVFDFQAAISTWVMVIMCSMLFLLVWTCVSELWFEIDESPLESGFLYLVIFISFYSILLPLYIPFSIYNLARELGSDLLQTFRLERQQLRRVSTERERLVVTDSHLALETTSVERDSWQTAWTLDFEHAPCRVSRVGPRLDRAEDAPEETEASASSDEAHFLLPALAFAQSPSDHEIETFGTRTRYLMGPAVGLVYEWWTGTTCAHRDPHWHRELDWLAAEIGARLDEASIPSSDPRT